MRENNITEGVIWKQILIFFLPILIGTFFQQLYNTVDAVVLGRFAGKEALACAGGSAGQIVSLAVGFFVGLTSGAGVLISQFYGAKNETSLQRAVHTAYAAAIVGGILCAAAGMAVSRGVLKLMNTPQELIGGSLLYLRIYFGGILFVFLYNMGAAILRAEGDSKRPLYALIAGTAANIVLDLLFIVLLHWGIAGAAAATVMAQAVSALFVTGALIRNPENLRLRISKIRINRALLSGMLKIGIPAGIQSSMYCISNIIVQRALNQFGVDTMAAWTAFGKIDGIVWMIIGAFGISITTFAGQNYGAGKWDRIHKGTREALLMTIASAVLFSAVVIPNGSRLFRIFLSDAEAIALGLRMMKVISATYFLFSFIEIFSGVLRAQGKVIITTVITILGVCVFRILWIMFVVPQGTLEQIIYCYPLTWIVTSLAMTGYYLYCRKQNSYYQ